MYIHRKNRLREHSDPVRSQLNKDLIFKMHKAEDEVFRKVDKKDLFDVKLDEKLKKVEVTLSNFLSRKP